MRVRHILLASSMLTLAAAGLCLAWPADEPAKAAAKAVVPFELLPSNHMLVRAKLNGKGPYQLIFDLGAPITLLNNRAAEGSGALAPDAPRSFLFGMRGEAQIDTLELGSLKAEKLPVIVMDHPALKVLSRALERPIDGIVGYTFFDRYKTTIDYQALEMTFVPVKHDVRNLMEDLPARLLGPRVAQHRVLAPLGLWGMKVGAPADGLDSAGVPIAEVLAGSPAAAAGLKPGDTLVSIDGRWTASVTDTYAAAATIKPGEAAPVVVQRDGKELVLLVRPAKGA